MRGWEVCDSAHDQCVEGLGEPLDGTKRDYHTPSSA